MAIAYAKLYELILKKVKDEKEAEELYKIVEEFIKENEQRIEQKFKNEKVIIKNELKDELRSELATKEDVLLAEERLRGEMKALEERLEKKIELVRRDVIIIALIIILAMYTPEIIGKLLLFK
ncbi:hypothetical protein [Methanotorris formicicus]|uniref:Uncharacterized protein n=1 Tax=Methanotorris formicicus Mc-S-70 TaxID=647171 RepID=H1KX87_9EURY|nr:hypothetical protein [Methanotorris formicicus]EHP88518.1 hypothetical protein MetfoDRAFT_0410 [Methanotorris formicicus Mc-S-70]